MKGRGATPFSRVGRNDPCPCGSGRKSKQCCGALRLAPPESERPGDVRRQPLTLGPLSEASELREAAEGLRASMYGARIPFGEPANAAGAAPQRQTGAAASCLSRLSSRALMFRTIRPSAVAPPIPPGVAGSSVRRLRAKAAATAAASGPATPASAALKGIQLSQPIDPSRHPSNGG